MMMMIHLFNQQKPGYVNSLADEWHFWLLEAGIHGKGYSFRGRFGSLICSTAPSLGISIATTSAESAQHAAIVENKKGKKSNLRPGELLTADA